MARVTIARCTDVPPDEVRGYEIDGRSITVCNLAGKYHAMAGLCPHRGGPLGEGFLDGDLVTCPWHGWQFDVTTGENPLLPAAKVTPLVVTIDGDALAVELD